MRKSNNTQTTQIPTDTHKKLQASLPFLPGHQFNLEKALLPNYRKSHAFDYCNSVSVFKKEAPGIGALALSGQDEEKIHTSVELYLKGEGEKVPAWIAFDRKVLRFYAYFQEAVHERREEQYRVRRVNIYFYLEDDTIHVSEPRSINSGIPQGTLIRRHRIPKDTTNGQHFIMSDLNLNSLITFYSRTFKIVGCDAFTREFLTSNGVVVGETSNVPSDPWEECRAELTSRMKPTRAYKPKTQLKRFLENDRHVLRFFCIWDDTSSMFGDVRHMVIHYFLSDGTIEIREDIAANSGRETNTLFLRRCKLPKKPHHVAVHGGLGAGRAGGAAGGGGGGEEDSSTTDFYTEGDLIIGSVLHFYGRPFVICDCDDFTRNYYRETFGLENFDPVAFDDEGAEEALIAAQVKKRQDEDIAFFARAQDATSASIIEPNILTHHSTREVLDKGATNELAAKKFDFKRMMQFDGIGIRFSAVLNSDRQLDRERKFIISLFPSDDTISVFEPRQRNSGILGGKFMEKGRILKAGNKCYYTTADFFVGADIELHGHKFSLVGADDFAINFMNAHPSFFPKRV